MNVNAEIRTLDDSELNLVTGGVIDGCIKIPGVKIFDPLPPTTPPWFGSTWTTVGETGTVPR